MIAWGIQCLRCSQYVASVQCSVIGISVVFIADRAKEKKKGVKTKVNRKKFSSIHVSCLVNVYDAIMFVAFRSSSWLVLCE